jgi:hypothetical protein
MKNYRRFLCVTMGGNINVDFIKHTIVDMLTSKWNSHSTVENIVFHGASIYSWILWFMKTTKYNTQRNTKCLYYNFVSSTKPQN